MPELHQDPTQTSLSNLLSALGNNAFPAQAQTQTGRQQIQQLVGEQYLTHRASYTADLPDSSMIRWLMDSQPTGTAVVSDQEPQADTAPQAPRIPSDQVRLITSFIGLGKSQMATIFGVSRQTLYDWLKGKIEPTGANADRVGVLSRAMAPACEGLRRPLYHGFITEASARGESSIMDLLEQESWDERELTRAFAQARRLNDEREQRLGLGGPPTSRTQGDNNQLDNSIAFGLE